MKKMADQINSVIDKLAEKLGMATNAIYPYLVKQAAVNGITDIVLCIVAVLFTIGFIFGVKKAYFTKDKDGKTWYYSKYEDDEEFGIILITIILAILQVILLFCLVGWICDAITAFMNPEYYALRDLLNMLKTTKS
jgi:hypothetical protein